MGWRYSSFLFGPLNMFQCFQFCCRRFSMLSISTSPHKRGVNTPHLDASGSCGFIFQTIPRCNWHEFMVPSTWKNMPTHLTWLARGWSIVIKYLTQIAQWITYKRVIYHRYLEFVAHSDWGIWCDGWMAFTLWDPRKQWKSVRMRKITSICHNLDRQADRQGRQETQYVSQSTYTQTQRDLGALLTCPITQTGSGKGTICAHMCEYLTYSTTPPPSFAAEIEACSMTLMITSTLCLP